MIQVVETQTKWVDICDLSDILPDTGVCALIENEQVENEQVENEQVAIFRYGNGEEVYALSNYDPFSKANVLSRGIVGDKKGIAKVASPIYKQNFSLATGQCLDDETVSIPTYKVKIVDGRVLLGING